MIEKLNREVMSIPKDVQTQLLSQGIEPLPGTSAELKARVAKELTEFSALAKQAKPSVE